MQYESCLLIKKKTIVKLALQLSIGLIHSSHSYKINRNIVIPLHHTNLVFIVLNKSKLI